MVNNKWNNNWNNDNNNNPPPQVDALMRILRLRPAKFSSAPEPMIALDWLRSVNKDLVTVGCTDAEKVRFVAFFEAFMIVGKTPTASLLTWNQGYKRMYMGGTERGRRSTVYNL
jgi:hypothetical protein